MQSFHPLTFILLLGVKILNFNSWQASSADKLLVFFFEFGPLFIDVDFLFYQVCYQVDSAKLGQTGQPVLLSSLLKAKVSTKIWYGTFLFSLFWIARHFIGKAAAAETVDSSAAAAKLLPCL